MRHEACGLTVLEAATRPRTLDARSLDRLYIGESLVAVVDGATPKMNMKGTRVEAFLAHILRSLKIAEKHAWSLDEFVSRSTMSEIGDPRLGSAYLPAATLAVVSATRSEVWRVGDAWVSIDGVSMEPDRQIEKQVALRRRKILTQHMERGYSVEELRSHDVGREAIVGELMTLSDLRNSLEPGGFGALDGGHVDSQFQEVWPLTDNTSHVTLATDGFLSPASTLDAAEGELAFRTARDPLMIEDPPATKGVIPGALSFDDRTYLRVEISHTEGCGCRI